jgi:hypothetical protein
MASWSSSDATAGSIIGIHHVCTATSGTRRATASSKANWIAASLAVPATLLGPVDAHDDRPSPVRSVHHRSLLHLEGTVLRLAVSR